MTSFWTPIRVGLVVAASVAAFGLGLYFIGAERFGRRQAYTVSAVFDDATGVGQRSRVQIAGITIGQVDKVELDQAVSKARVYLKIKKEYVLHKNATITKRSESILGDFLLDVSPGSSDQPVLKEGDEITIVIRQPSIGEIFNAMSRIANDIQDMTQNLRKVLGSEEGEQNIRNVIASLRRITDAIERTINTSSGKLNATLANFQGFSGDLRRLTGNESDDVVAIIKNTRQATQEARDILKSIGEVVGSSQKGEFKESVKSLKQNLDKLDKSLANVQEVTDKINRGQGTLGHLVNDDKLAKNLDKASTALTTLLGTAEGLKIEVNERSELLLGAPNAGTIDPNVPPILAQARDVSYNPWAKNYFGIRIIPRPDKWYGIELVDDPRGVTKRVRTVNNVGCGATLNCNTFFPDAVEQTITERQLKFSVYLAKRYGPVSLRFGLLENTGGFGLKGHFLNDSLTVSFDAYEFANPLKDRPRVKLYADYRFLDHLFVTVGADDLVNKPFVDPEHETRIISGREFFIGGGLYCGIL